MRTFKDFIVNEALKVINSKNYNTKFGIFRLETKKGKVRRRDGWKEITTTGGYFIEFPTAVEYWLENDYGNLVVSSSQGDNYKEWVESLECKTYEEALKKVDDEVVKCFRDYYKDNTIQ